MRTKLKICAFVLSFVLAGGTAFSQNVIKSSDLPDGFASLGIKKGIFGANGKKVVTVNNAKDFKSYAGKGGYVIYVDGMIDITDGLLPKDGNDSSGNLNSFISKNTGGKINSWSEWREKFAATQKITSDYAKNHSSDGKLNGYWSGLSQAWMNLILVKIGSNTTIIGLTENSGLKGADLLIQGTSNIVIRNMILQDAIDPFPHHEEYDGYNAENDLISIINGSNIWIDHCTLQDTIVVGLENYPHVKLGDGCDEKYQIYDGALDLKGSSTNITISYCHIRNHDKTMLWGSGDSESFSGKRFISFHHNYLENCKQRLPLIRNSYVHIFNNYWNHSSDSLYKSDQAIQTRAGSNVISEGNYFGEKIQYSVTGSSSKPGNLYENSNVDKTMRGKKDKEYVLKDSPMFKIPYEYNLEKADKLNSSIPVSVGAGKLKVEK